jgi:hypothetical protein
MAKEEEKGNDGKGGASLAHNPNPNTSRPAMAHGAPSLIQ